MTVLLSDAATEEASVAKLISDRASHDFVPGSSAGFERDGIKLRRAAGPLAGATGAGQADNRPRWAQVSRPSSRMGEVRGDTVLFDIIDQAGNMISAALPSRRLATVQPA